MIYVTRRERFCSAHRLCRQDWDSEKNDKVYGLCANPQWHGHNYVLWVTVKGNVNPETGFLINLKDLSHLIKASVIDKMDHKNINEQVDFMKDQLASTENIAISIWNVLEPLILVMGARLHYIKLEETENNFVEYYGEV